MGFLSHDKAAAAMWPDSVTAPPIPKPRCLRTPPLGLLATHFAEFLQIQLRRPSAI